MTPADRVGEERGGGEAERVRPFEADDALKARVAEAYANSTRIVVRAMHGDPVDGRVTEIRDTGFTIRHAERGSLWWFGWSNVAGGYPPEGVPPPGRERLGL